MKVLYTILTISMTIHLHAQTIRHTIQEELLRYPKLQIQDLYKFAYQAAMGNVHFVRDSLEVWNDVIHQLSSVEASPHEPLFIPLTPEKRIVRLSLRAAKYYGLSPALIVDAILHTARTVQPSQELLDAFLLDIEKLADDGLLPFSYTAVRTYFQTMKEKRYPPVHHSDAFMEAYAPAYYIISGTQSETILEKLR